MSEWKKLALGFGVFASLAFMSENYWNNDKEAQAQTQVPSQAQVVVEKTNTLSNYEVVEKFSLMMGERAEVWLEGDTVILFEGSVIYVSNKPESITLSEAGNYMILGRD